MEFKSGLSADFSLQTLFKFYGDKRYIIWLTRHINARQRSLSINMYIIDDFLSK